ncbi:MAG: LytTR family DNA-binding domain-containing protein [Cyclobacteriaceae bacterium]
MKISTVIIDDEPYARMRVRKLLQIDEEIEIVGEVASEEEAYNLLRLKRPEVIFLDIKMPDGTGFDVLARFKTDYNPYVVFITAYDNYALKAFEHNAIDYILKPFDNSRFFKAVERAKEFIALKRSSKINKKISELINHDRMELYERQREQIKISEKGWDIFIDYQDIVMFEANGNYCKIHLEKKFYLYKKTMKELSDELNDSEFLRVHRSYILQINHIINVKYLGKNEYEFELSNSEKVTSGRSFSPHIKEYLSLKISSHS